MKAKFFKKAVSLIILSLLFSNILVGCSSNKTPTEKPSKEENNKNNVSSEKAKVVGKVKLSEGIYFDDRRFGENLLREYCEIKISNVTDTSFDFTIYKITTDGKKEDKKVVFFTSTASFIEDGTKASFSGTNNNLLFTFPNDRKTLPVAVEIQVSGFEPLKGITLVNNGIPGYEFG